MYMAGALSFCQADSLTDDLSFLVNAAAELCFGPRNQMKGDFILFLCKLTVKCQLRDLVQDVIFDF